MNENLASRLRHIAGLVERYPDEIPDEWFNSAIKRVDNLMRPDTLKQLITIINIVGEGMGLPPRILLIRDKRQRIVIARWIAWYIARQITDASYPFIARYFAADHSTIIYGVNKIQDRVHASPAFRETVLGLTKTCRWRTMPQNGVSKASGKEYEAPNGKVAPQPTLTT